MNLGTACADIDLPGRISGAPVTAQRRRAIIFRSSGVVVFRDVELVPFCIPWPGVPRFPDLRRSRFGSNFRRQPKRRGTFDMRAERKLPNAFNVICPVQTFRRKYSCFQNPQISVRNPAVSSLNEGRIRIVTYVGMRCGGRGSVGRDCDRRVVLRTVSHHGATDERR
jgi:hypothetical protein